MKSMKRLHEPDEAADMSTAKWREQTRAVSRQSAKRKRKRRNAVAVDVVEANDLLSGLPIELQHEIVVCLFRCHPASVGCLDATGRTLHAAVRSARINVESWPHRQRVRVSALSLARLACVTGARNEMDAMTGLALAVMYAYVAGSVNEKECRYNRGLERRNSQVPQGSGPLIERLGLPDANSASPDALVEWITSNHRALDQRAGPPLFPAVTERIQRCRGGLFAPATMGKYWTPSALAPRGKEILRVGGPFDAQGRARDAPHDTDALDLLFGRHGKSMEALADLPYSTTTRISSPCFCEKGPKCQACLCVRTIADALDRPITQCRALEWIDKRTADHMPTDIASCIADCPRLGLAFSDLFCVSDMHAASCLDNFLFFGIVQARFDVEAFMASASRLRAIQADTTRPLS